MRSSTRNNLILMKRDSRNIVPDAIAEALQRIAIRRGAPLLIALSGGADCVALTNALLDLRERFDLLIAAAHMNHRIRPRESDRDEAFVHAMCERLRIELRVERADGLDAGSPNLEERARDARYLFLNRAADAIGADYIALAHHADDQAETVLMRIFRGAGIAGLAAMAERGPGRLIRPMLALNRAQILAYLRERKIPFVEDSSNSSPEISRNRIRTELIPMLEREYAPGLRRRLTEVAGEMRAVDDFMISSASLELDAMQSADAIAVARLATLAPALQMTVLRLFLASRMESIPRISRAHLEALPRLALAGRPSDSIDLPNGWRAAREYNLLRITNTIPQGAETFSVPLNLDGVTIVEAAGYQFEASTIGTADAPASTPKDHRVALFDAAALADSELLVRNFIRGDRINPLGMRGTHKVQGVRNVKDVFI